MYYQSGVTHGWGRPGNNQYHPIPAPPEYANPSTMETAKTPIVKPSPDVEHKSRITIGVFVVQLYILIFCIPYVFTWHQCTHRMETYSLVLTVISICGFIAQFIMFVLSHSTCYINMCTASLLSIPTVSVTLSCIYYFKQCAD